MKILEFVKTHPENNYMEIVAGAKLPKATVNVNLTKLETMGYIKRVRKNTDVAGRPPVLQTITEEGRMALEAFYREEVEAAEAAEESGPVSDEDARE